MSVSWPDVFRATTFRVVKLAVGVESQNNVANVYEITVNKKYRNNISLKKNKDHRK